MFCENPSSSISAVYCMFNSLTPRAAADSNFLLVQGEVESRMYTLYCKEGEDGNFLLGAQATRSRRRKQAGQEAGEKDGGKKLVFSYTGQTLKSTLQHFIHVQCDIYIEDFKPCHVEKEESLQMFLIVKNTYRQKKELISLIQVQIFLRK